MNSDGSVKDYFKISDLTDGFNGSLSDEGNFSAPTYLGDLNGDGFLDIAVGALRDDTGGSNKGAVYVIFGKDSCSLGSEEAQACTLSPSFSPVGQVCRGQTQTILNQTTNNPIYEYNWYVNGVLVDTTRNLTYNFAQAGTQTVNLVVSDTVCSVLYSDGVEVLSKTASLRVLDSVVRGCENEPIRLQATGAGLLDYRWTPATGLSCTVCTSPTATVSDTSIFIVTSAADSAGCAARDSVLVIPECCVNGAIASAGFTMSDSLLCESDNQPITFNFEGNVSGNATINWTFENSSITTFSGQNPLDVSFSTPGLHRILLAVNDVCGTLEDSGFVLSPKYLKIP